MDYIKEKLKHPGFKKYLKNTWWMFVGRIFSLAVSFFVSVYMARNLGVESFGTLNFVISFVGITGTSLFVIDSIVLKKLNNEADSVNKILGSSLVIKLINAAVAIITATSVSFIFAQSSLTTILVFVFSTFAIFNSVNGIDLYFKARADFKEAAIANIVTNTITAIVRIVVVYLQFPIVYILATYVFDAFISALSYIYLYKRNFGSIFSWKFDRVVIKGIIIDSWPFTISALATAIYMSVDQVFLKYFLGSEAVGLYVVAVRFSEVWFFISGVVCTSLLPAILNAQKTNYALFLERSKKLYSLLFYLAILISAGIYIAAPLIVNTLYSAEYSYSIVLLRIYVWSIVGMFVSTALQQTLLAQNKFKTILVLNIIGMSLSLLCNPIFIYLYGVKGAAIANIVAYTLPVVVLVSARSMKEYRKLLWAAIFKPFTNI